VDFQVAVFAHLGASSSARAELPLLCCREHPIRVKSEGVMSDINYMAFVEHKFQTVGQAAKYFIAKLFTDRDLFTFSTPAGWPPSSANS